GLPCLQKKSLSASIIHACIVVSRSTASIRNCFRADTRTQNGTSLLPSRSEPTASGCGPGWAAPFGRASRTAAWLSRLLRIRPPFSCSCAKPRIPHRGLPAARRALEGVPSPPALSCPGGLLCPCPTGLLAARMPPGLCQACPWQEKLHRHPHVNPTAEG